MGQDSKTYGDLIQANKSVCIIFKDWEQGNFDTLALSEGLDKDIAIVIIKKHLNLEIFKALSINN